MSPPCRLFVIMASAAPVAAILRRGPSRWTQVIAWDTRRDVFTDGAGFKGRIYEDRCDVSPDGTLLLSFCHGGRSRDGYTDSWSAVSRLPWLHALGLWPSGTTYGGGGRFTGNREIVLRTGMPIEVHPDHPGLGLRVTGGRPELQRSTGMPDTEWSGVDQDGRPVYCRSGKVFRRARRTGAKDLELADFNGRRPEPSPAPDWARVPLEARSARRSPRR
ncbi:MAG TPA: hypothetical protein VIY73_28680 [Polyangiaceae bacterium]